MVQPKYSPEEALQRIKLMMEYDLSKTSTENRKVVLEQTTDLTIDDIKNGKSVVKMGMKGPIVGKIQELLASAGYPDISKSGKIDNDFGSLTKAEVENFQSDNTNDEGEPLQKDGKVGPETIKALLKRTDVKTSKSARGETPTDLRLAPKEFGQISKATPDPFLCIKNYYADYESKLSADLRNKIKYEYFQDYMSITRPILNTDVEGKYKENFFKDGKYELIRDGRWSDWKTGKYTQFNDSQESKWFCMGERKYGVDDLKPSPEDKTTTPIQPVSQQTQPVSQQTQPVSQQTQPVDQQDQSVNNSVQNTGLAAGYLDPNQQSTLRRRDSPLDDILENQDINKSACRKNISDYFNAWRTRSVVPDDIQKAAKNIVQQCSNQNYGKFGINGRKFDEMLDVLMGNHPDGIKQHGEDKQWRIQKPIIIQNTRRK
jgi:hypothetical protein